MRVIGHARKQVGHEDRVLPIGPVALKRVAVAVGHAVRQPRIGHIGFAQSGDVGKIDDRRREVGVRLAQRDREGARAAADVEQGADPGKIDALGEAARRAQGSGVLAFGIEPRLFGVGEPLVVAVGRIFGHVAGQGIVDLVHQRIHLLAHLPFEVVGEVVFRPFHQKRVGGGRVGEGAVIVDRRQVEAGERGHERAAPLGRQSDPLGQRARVQRTRRERREDVELDRGEQGLGPHVGERDI